MFPADTCSSKTCQLSSGWDHYRAGGAPQKCRSTVTAACLPFVSQFLSQLGSAPVSATLQVVYPGLFPTTLSFTT
jgi:hypothetical protein